MRNTKSVLLTVNSRRGQKIYQTETRKLIRYQQQWSNGCQQHQQQQKMEQTTNKKCQQNAKIFISNYAANREFHVRGGV